MTTHAITPADRSGQSNLPQGVEQAHTLIILVEDRPGSVDRVIGLLRRRRANMQTFVLGRGAQPEIVRITVTVNDSEVAIEHLVEQLRKVVDVQQVTSLVPHLTVARELALIKVESTAAHVHEIIERSDPFGAHVVAITSETLTLEVMGNEEKIEKLIELLQPYGIREIARSGRVAMARGADEEV